MTVRKKIQIYGDYTATNWCNLQTLPGEAALKKSEANLSLTRDHNTSSIAPFACKDTTQLVNKL